MNCIIVPLIQGNMYTYIIPPWLSLSEHTTSEEVTVGRTLHVGGLNYDKVNYTYTEQVVMLEYCTIIVLILKH